MAYLTRAGLFERVSADRLAQASSRDSAVVRGALLNAAHAGDFAGVSDADRKAAEAAIEKLDEVVADANAVVDGFIKARYPYLFDAVDKPANLESYAADFAVYSLLGGDVGTKTYVKYRDAQKYLERVQSGETDLPLLAPPAVSGVVQTAGSERTFTPAVWERF